MKVEDIARDVVASVRLSAQWVLAAHWVSLRYQEIGAEGTRRFRHLRRVFELTIPATVQTGLATTVQGSNRVSGNAAAQAAWAAISGDLDARRHRVFRTGVGTQWYAIIGLEGGQLVLEQPMAEAGTTAGAYTVVARFVRLDASVRQAITFGHPRLFHALDLVNMADLDLNAPTRNLVGSGPDEVAEAVTDPDGCKTFEFYPYVSTTAEIIRYLCYIHPPALAADDLIPPTIDPIKLREGVLIDAMRYKAAEMADNGKLELAAFWRNEYRAQETRWEKMKEDVALMDMGADDASLIYDPMVRAPRRRAVDIRTAYDQIWSRYP